MRLVFPLATMPAHTTATALLGLLFLLSQEAAATLSLSILAIAVKDRQSGQPVDGAVVLLDGNVVAETGATGAARVEGVPSGRHLISVVSASHDVRDEELRLSPGEVRALDIAMTASTAEQVNITEKAIVDRVPISEVALSREEVTRVAGTMGDPVRVVESLPGMGRAPGGFGGALIVRGANPADTSVFVDGVEVPLLYHFGGLTSVISGELLGDITFSPGGFGAQFGRATAGVVQVGTKTLNCDRLQATAAVDFLDAEGYVCAPVGRWKLAGAARRSYIDAFLPALMRGAASGDEPPIVASPSYLDYQAKAERTWMNHRFDVLAFGSRDALTLSRSGSAESSDLGVEGAIAFHRVQLRHKYFWNGSSNLETAITPGYLSQDIGDHSQDLDIEHKAGAHMSTLSWRETLNIGIAETMTLRMGLDHRLLYWNANFVSDLPTLGHRFPTPVPFDRRVQNPWNSSSLDLDQAYWTELSLSPTRRLTVLPGLRYSHLDFDRTERWVLEPRLAARYDLSERTRLKATSGVYRKLPDLFSGVMVEGIGQPALAAERAFHLTAGVDHDFGPLLINVEGFKVYRDNLPSPTDAQIMKDGQLQPALFDSGGKGESHGVEVLVKRNAQPDRRFSGWLAYTLSRSTRSDRSPDSPVPGQPEGANPGTPRFATLPRTEQTQLSPYDQTHILTAVGQVALPWNMSLGVRFQLVTGNPLTPQDRGQIYFDADADAHKVVPGTVARSSDRLPTFHKVDLRVDKKWQFRSFNLTAYLDVMNAYNHQPVEALGYDYRYRNRTLLLGLPILPLLGVKGEI